MAARVGEQSAVVWKRVKLRPCLARASRLGVGTCPPKVPHWPKPESSMRMMRTLGAPAGALMIGILEGVDSLYVSPMVPAKGASGAGRTTAALVLAGRGSGGAGGEGGGVAVGAAAFEVSGWLGAPAQPTSANP